MTDCVLRRGFRGPALVCGVLIRGETYDLGDDASDVNDMGDWLDCWAVRGNIIKYNLRLNS